MKGNFRTIVVLERTVEMRFPCLRNILFLGYVNMRHIATISLNDVPVLNDCDDMTFS